MKETHMKQRSMIVVGVAVALLTGVPLHGHHSGSTLFSETTSTLKGSVAKWVWSNPHCLLTVDVKGEDGQVVSWVVELQAPNTIYPAGYRANIVQARRPRDGRGAPGLQWPALRPGCLGDARRRQNPG